MPDGFRTDADASPIDCIGVTDTTPRVVYESLPMLEAARQSYFNWDEGVAVSGADAAVIRMASDDAARSAFDGFVEQWRRCDGTTVDKRLRGEMNTHVYSTIEGVAVDGSLLTATLRTRPDPDGPVSVYERALGVRGDTIVEVSAALTPAGERRGNFDDVAARSARAMLDNV